MGPGIAKLWIAALILVAWLGGAAAQSADAVDHRAAAQPKQILFLYSIGPNFQPWAAWSRAARQELNRQSPWPLDIQEQSLVGALRGDETVDAKFLEYLTALYAQRKPDLIVAIGAPAARFVQQHRAKLFPKTPMLLAVVEARRVRQSMLSEQDAVVALKVDLATIFQDIFRLLPDTKTVAFIVGNSPGERLWIEDVQQELKPLLQDRVELRFYNEQPFAQMLAALADLPPDSVIFFQQMMIDGAGAVYGDKEPLKRIFNIANAPIFTFDKSFFDGEAVGGPMTSPTEGGRATAGAALRMLNGEKAGDINVPPITLSTPTYDWRLLQRWNISEGRLPPGSVVLFRESSAWERYSLQISLVTMAVLLQAGIIASLLRERHRRHLAEVQARQRMVELAHANRFSTAGELGAMIAHEINQPLGAILSNAEAAQIILQSPQPDIPMLTEIVGEIVHSDERATEVIKRIRSLLKKAPFEMREFDLNDLVRETVEFLDTLARGRKFELRSFFEPDPLAILGDRIQLQQVVLNLAMNAIDAMKEMASENRVIVVGTSRVEGQAELSVSDLGPGIPGDRLKHIFEPFFTTKADGMGMGLSIAVTIVEAHNGTISAQNQDQGGASFRIRLPLVR